MRNTQYSLWKNVRARIKHKSNALTNTTVTKLGKSLERKWKGISTLTTTRTTTVPVTIHSVIQAS